MPYEGLVEAKDLIKSSQCLTDDTIVRLKKLELDYVLARVGLQGTLCGALGSLVVITLVIVSPLFTNRDLLTGWQIVVMVGIIVVAIVFYGTFIFQRALTVSAKSDKDGGISVTVEALLEERLKLEEKLRRARHDGSKSPNQQPEDGHPY